MKTADKKREFVAFRKERICMNTKKATTAEELKQKYGRKRFSSDAIGKAFVITNIFREMLFREGMQVEEIMATPLYEHLHEAEAEMESVRDKFLFESYLHLNNWIDYDKKSSAYISASAQNYVAFLFRIATDLVVGEGIGTIFSGGHIAKKSALQILDNASGIEHGTERLLSYATLKDAFPGTEKFNSIVALRQEVQSGFRYLKAHNAYIDLIADQLDIPEFSIYEIGTDRIDRILPILNLTLADVRDLITKKDFDNELRAQLLVLFDDVTFKTPPIPDENMSSAKTEIENLLARAEGDLNSGFLALTHNYWGD